MKPSPLCSRPNFVSHFNGVHHTEYEEAAAKRVREYLHSCWPWTSERQKEVYAENDGEILTFIACCRAPEDRAEIGARYMVSYYALDDFLETVAQDKAIKTVEGIKRVLLYDHPPQNKLEKVMHDLRSQILSFGDTRTHGFAHDAFILTVKYLEHVINRSERSKALAQGLDSFLEYRRPECGFWFCVAIYAWELDLGLPPKHIREDTDFYLLFNLAIDQMSLLNDMYSYRREALELMEKHRKLDIAGETAMPQHGDEYNMFNAVCILLREENVDETNVMEKLGALIHRKESGFIETAEKLRGRYRDHAKDLGVIEEWIRILAEWMAANTYWSAICRRYNNLVTE